MTHEETDSSHQCLLDFMTAKLTAKQMDGYCVVRTIADIETTYRDYKGTSWTPLDAHQRTSKLMGAPIGVLR